MQETIQTLQDRQKEVQQIILFRYIIKNFIYLVKSYCSTSFDQTIAS